MAKNEHETDHISSFFSNFAKIIADVDAVMAHAALPVDRIRQCFSLLSTN